ncbi:MAG: carboxypeptidase M32 [Syntrophobacteraceae bacterium]
MKPQDAYDWLVNDSLESSYFDSMRSLLVWDQRTFLPIKGQAHRADQLAVLAKLLHARRTNSAVGEHLTIVEASDLVADPLSVAAINVREWRRAYDKMVKIPERLAVELTRAASEGQGAWQKARPANDWEGFKPFLERIIRLKIEEADCLGYPNEPYDALLDQYEPGESARSIEPVLTELREPLVSLLHRICDRDRKEDHSLAQARFPTEAQHAFARHVLARLGYDFDSGRLDTTAHPFTVGIGPGDVRITTRYDEAQFAKGFFGSVHEAGHALYDSGLPEKHWGTPMGDAVSLGIHESQSRLWENMVSRSLGFWELFYRDAQRYFPALAGVELETFHRSVNLVRPSFIRTEADEVTYNLHVLLRFEIERDLMRGSIRVDDLPSVWDQKMQTTLGIRPPDHSQGVLQDIHWSSGAIGYFPTYTLGNLYAAQFHAAAERELGNLQDHFRRGEFTPLLGWLRANIHAEGSRFRPRDLVRKVTGEAPGSSRFVDYLTEKFTDLYRLS